jgi:signal transduction histidine kinase
MKKSGIVLLVSAILFFAFQLGIIATAEEYAYDQTKELVAFVNDAASLVAEKGDAAFPELRKDGSKWRRLNRYIFVVDPDGNMLVHPNPDLEGTNQLGLEDVNRKPIIRGIIKAVAAHSDGSGSWYHYQFPEPGSIFVGWKSTYSRSVTSPSGKTYIVSAGLYNMKMEKSFAVDMVNDAIKEIKKSGEKAFKALRDPKTQFRYENSYVFVIGEDGTDLVHPGFPNLEGRNIIDAKDVEGKYPIREMMDAAKTKGSGWVEYMWPKPGEPVSLTKTSYAAMAQYGGKRYLVGSGIYLDGAARKDLSSKVTANDVTSLVKDAAALLEKEGDAAFSEFRRKGSKWFEGDTYLFVYDLDGNKVFYAPDPQTEGKNFLNEKDAYGKPVIRMLIDEISGKSGDGWAHYLWPKPDAIFPSWKSSFVKRVKVPSGKTYIVGCGIYDMKMDKDFITGVVDQAAALIEKEGTKAFVKLRDKAGPFVFLDTYVFVGTPEGIVLVDPAFPGVESTSIIGFRDANNKAVTVEYIDMALKNGSGWVTYLWPKPGETSPSVKHVYVKKVVSDGKTYIVGSGMTLDQP